MSKNLQTLHTEYNPRPLDTSRVQLPPFAQELVEAMAENCHENWSQARLQQGWVYGPERSDANRTHPCLVPYSQLSEEEKEYDRRTSLEALRFILANGYRLVKD